LLHFYGDKASVQKIRKSGAVINSLVELIPDMPAWTSREQQLAAAKQTKMTRSALAGPAAANSSRAAGVGGVPPTSRNISPGRITELKLSSGASMSRRPATAAGFSSATSPTRVDGGTPRENVTCTPRRPSTAGNIPRAVISGRSPELGRDRGWRQLQRIQAPDDTTVILYPIL